MEILLKTADILVKYNAIIGATYKNHSKEIVTSLKIEIPLKTADISADCNTTAVVTAEVGLFYLIFSSIFIFSLIKIITEE